VTRVRPSSRCDGGATLIETAFVLPALFALVFGGFAVGSAMRVDATVSSAVHSGGRAASVSGADPMSDRNVLAQIAHEAAGISPSHVELVVIWHAAAPGDRVPDACRPTVGTAPSTVSIGTSDAGSDLVGACGVYINPDLAGGAFSMAQGTATHPAAYYFGCQGSADPNASQKVDCRWPGKDRRDMATPRAAFGPHIPPDFVGVYIQVRHHFSAVAISSDLKITQSSVNLIEPKAFSL
jgi:hypothetical protein